MIETCDEIRGDLAPEGIMPAELAGAKHGKFVENVEVCPHSVDLLDRSGDIARNVVRYAWSNSERSGAFHERPDSEGPVGHGRVCMTVDRTPGHPRPGSGRMRVVSVPGRRRDDT